MALFVLFFSGLCFSAPIGKNNLPSKYSPSGNSAVFGSSGVPGQSSIGSAPGPYSVPIGDSGWWVGTAQGAPKGTTMNMDFQGNAFFSGTKYPFQAGYQVGGSDVASAAMSVLGGKFGAALGAALLAYPHIAEWLSDSGATPNPEAASENEAFEVEPFADYGCSTAYSNYLSRNPSFGTTAGGCFGSYGGDYIIVTSVRRENNSCRAYFVCAEPPHRSSSVSLGSFDPTEDQQKQYEDANQVAQRMSNTPFSPGVIAEIIDAGGSISPSSPPQYTGPSTVTGETTTTTTKGSKDGRATTTTKTTTPVNHFTWNDNRVTNNRTVTNISSVTVFDDTGEVIEDGSEIIDEDKEDKDPVIDTPVPEIPELYQQKYKDGLSAVVSQKIADIKATPLFQLPSQLMGNLPDSGSCPSWTLDLNIASWAPMGTWSVGADCSIWAFARICVIIGALILARALIAGG